MKHRGRRRGRLIDLPRATMVQRGVARLALSREASPGVLVPADDPRLAVDLAPIQDPQVGERTAGVMLHEKLPDTLSERQFDLAIFDDTGVRLSSGRNDDILPYLPIQIGRTDSLGTFVEVARFDVENVRLGVGITPTEALDVVGNVRASGDLKFQSGTAFTATFEHALGIDQTYTLTNGGTVWTSGNDGSGSGLDADLLDGLDSTAFALVGHTHTFNDLSDVTLSGVATGDYVRKSAGDWVNVTVAQLLTDLKTVDGPGSGLDADTLDGLNSTAFQPIDATLTAFAALVIAANSLTIGTGADAFSQTTFSANTFPARASAGDLVAKTITDFGLSLVDDADAATARSTLGLGTIAVENTPLALAKGGTNADLSATGGASFVLRQSSAGAAITVSQLASTDISGFDEAAQDAAASLIQNGTGISWSYNDGANTLTPTVTLAPFSTADLAEGANLYYTDERVDDRVAALIQNGTGISWVYSDAGGTLTPTVTLAPFSTGDLSEGANLYFTNERVDDRVAALVQNGTGISWSYNDGAGTLTPTVSLAAFSTTDLAEGANLYFTNERAQDAIGAALTDSTSIDLIYDDAGNAISAQREALTGDVTAAKNSNATTIANDAVTFAKIQNAAAWTVVVRNAGSAGDLSAAALADITTEGTPAAGMYALGFLSGGDIVKFNLSAFLGSYTDEQAQDAVGSIFVDSGTIDLDYDDVGGTITASVKAASIDLSTHVANILPIANGGTGQSTQTSAFDALAPTTAAGEFTVHNGTDNVAISIGAPRSVFVADPDETEGVSARKLEYADMSYKGSRGHSWVDHFQSGTTAGETNWTVALASGSSTINTALVDGNHTGIVELSTAASTTGSAYLWKNACIVLGGGPIVLEFLVRIEDLSALAQEYDLFFGLSNTSTGHAAVHCVGFLYDRNTNTNWLCRVRQSGAATDTNSGVAVAADAWIHLRIEIDDDASDVRFYIDGSLVHTETGGNIPNGGEALGHNFGIAKSAGSTARVIYCDWVGHSYEFTSEN